LVELKHKNKTKSLQLLLPKRTTHIHCFWILSTCARDWNPT